MTRANGARLPTLEQTIEREVQDRLDHHTRVLRQPGRIRALKLYSEGALFVVPVEPEAGDMSEEAVRVLAASRRFEHCQRLVWTCGRFATPRQFRTTVAVLPKSVEFEKTGRRKRLPHQEAG